MSNFRAHFRVSSAIKSLIGKELITNDYVAVFELVKNSFDAKATNISVYFDLSKQSITIKDDGVGMSLDDIENRWLFIGFSEKRNNRNDLLSGNKGIGRFSCDRLGATLVLETIRDGIESSFSIDWNQFDDKQQEEIQNAEVTINTNKSNKPNGTTIIITDLRRRWGEKDAEKAKDQLLRLLSPNIIDEKRQLSVFVENESGVVNSFLNLHNDVFDYMKPKVVRITALFNEDNIVTELSDHGRRILKNVSKNNTLLKSAHMELFFADKSAKIIFKKKTGIDLVEYGNLFVYKNNFRIYPFGERGYDSFQLTQRKTQGYNRYLGPREIIGWISLIDKENHFIEATSRDRGFIDNEYVTSLENSYMEYIHRPLEKYVELIKYGNISIDDFLKIDNAGAVLNEMAHSFAMKDSISTEIDSDFLKAKTTNEILNQLYNNELSRTELEKVVETAKQQALQLRNELGEANKATALAKKENENLKKEIEAKNRFIEVENPSRQSVLEHDLGLVSRKMRTAVEQLYVLTKETNNKQINKCIETFAWSVYRINSIRNVILKTKINTKTKTEIKIGELFKEYSKIVEYEDVKISIHVESEFVIKMFVFDIITIFDNFLSNVENMSGTTVDVYINSSAIKFVSDTFDENSEIDFSRVFDFGYTTTSGGTGIGMFIVKQICKENKMSIEMGRVDNTNMVYMEIGKNA